MLFHLTCCELFKVAATSNFSAQMLPIFSRHETRLSGFGPPPSPPVASPIGANDHVAHLTLRFARALTRRQRTRRLSVVSGTSASSTSVSRASRASTGRRGAAVSKNCATVQRDTTARQRRAHQDLEAEEKSREAAELEAAVRELRRAVASLERSQLLADSSLMTWRTNRNGLALDVCREYFVHFARGFNATDPARAERSVATRAFMARAVEPDLLTRDFQGVDAFLAQWQTYTTCYDNFSARMCSLALIDDGDQYVSVSAAAEMRFAFSPRSLQALYPHLYTEMQTSAVARAATEKLFGRECRVAFDVVFHFNQRGKVFVTESRVHLASALLDLMADPFAVMRVLNASLITQTGHWMTPESEICESSNELPKSVL